MNDRPRRSILVLAGLPGSGVAELLQEHGLSDLFGRFSMEFVRRDRKPYYFFKNFKAKVEKNPDFAWPDQVVLHLEITAACSFKLNPYQMFRNENFVTGEFVKNLSSLLSPYTYKVINTVELDLPSLAQRFFERSHELSNVSRLYNDRDEETFQCILNAWKRYIAETDCYQFRTEWDDQKQNFRVIDVSQKQQSSIDPPYASKATFSTQWRVRV